jgi:lipoate-protein ligase A
MTSAPTKWRLLRTQPAQGAWNMAVDEAILELSGLGSVPPTIRLYGWSPPCLSFGYAQPTADVNMTKLKERGWDIVRRPTGGRAILHTDELTYSICGPNNLPQLKGGVLESYQKLSEALLVALHLLGIDADTPKKSDRLISNNDENPVCFEVPSNYEITVGGRKLIGSAQARRKSGVLQHGSLPMTGDLSRIIDVLNYQQESHRQKAKTDLLIHATTLERELGYTGDWWITSYAFEKAFQKILNADLQAMDLTPAEGHRALELYNEKYNHPGWTNRM